MAVPALGTWRDVETAQGLCNSQCKKLLQAVLFLCPPCNRHSHGDSVEPQDLLSGSSPPSSVLVQVTLAVCSSLDAVRLGSSGVGHICKEPWSKKIHDKLIF